MMNWISVNDRLPEYKVCVLACDTNGLNQRYMNYFFVDFREWGWHHYGSSDICIVKLTHWMPLPEMPKPNKE